MSPVSAQDLLAAVQAALGFAPEWTLAFVHDGNPKPKQRARTVLNRKTGKVRTFTPEETEQAETALAWRWKAALKGKTHEGALAIACVFFRADRQKVDADNLVKLVMDAGTKARAWKDDSQVVTIIARIERDAARPRTEVVLMPTVTTLDRKGFGQVGLDLGGAPA